MSQQAQNPEAQFLSGLQDLHTIATKLAPHVQSVPDLVAMIELAFANDGQLRLLMALVNDRTVVKGRLPA